MKWTTAIAALGTFLAGSAFAATDYSVFRVCQDQHVIRTSDGAEAGRIEYIVVDPTDHRIVSAVLTGGVVEKKFIVVPFEDVEFGGAREITLRKVTRERLVSAPVIEEQRLTRVETFEPQIIERSYSHFGLSTKDLERTRRESRTTSEFREGTTEPSRGTTMKERERRQRGEAATTETSPEPVAEQTGKEREQNQRERSLKAREKAGTLPSPESATSSGISPTGRAGTGASPSGPESNITPGGSPGAQASPYGKSGTGAKDSELRSPLEGKSTPSLQTSPSPQSRMGTESTDSPSTQSSGRTSPSPAAVETPSEKDSKKSKRATD